MTDSYSEYIGRHVKYFSHIGEEMYGTIVFIEPSDSLPDCYYVYIENEDQELNIHSVEVNGTIIMYADICPNEEVYLD